MLTIEIPGYRTLRLGHLVSDYNGTLAMDGKLLPGVASLLEQVSAHVQIHVITADTFGLAQDQLAGLPVEVVVLPPGREDEAKLAFVSKLGADSVASLGNGRNDGLMLAATALGICLVQEEGASVPTLMAADIVCSSAQEALALLVHPKRLVATLRS